MEAFVGTGFDVESNFIEIINSFVLHRNDCLEVLQAEPKALTRPRLNKPQVLDNYDWVKEVRGAVWDLSLIHI